MAADRLGCYRPWVGHGCIDPQCQLMPITLHQFFTALLIALDWHSESGERMRMGWIQNREVFVVSLLTCDGSPLIETTMRSSTSREARKWAIRRIACHHFDGYPISRLPRGGGRSGFGVGGSPGFDRHERNFVSFPCRISDVFTKAQAWASEWVWQPFCLCLIEPAHQHLQVISAQLVDLPQSPCLGHFRSRSDFLIFAVLCLGMGLFVWWHLALL